MKYNTEIKFVKCVLQDDEIINAFENYTYDKNYQEKKLIEVALGKFLQEEGYLE